MPPPRVTIDSLPPKATPEDTDLVIIQDGGGTKRATIDAIRGGLPAELTAHINAVTDAHVATAVSATDSGSGINSTTVQGQLGQLAGALNAATSNASAAVAAAGAATTVADQAALDVADLETTVSGLDLGAIDSVVGGDNVTVDTTDPRNPVVSVPGVVVAVSTFDFVSYWTGLPPALFPTADSVGLPSGWTAVTTVTTGTQHTTPGAVIEDVLFDGSSGTNGVIAIQAQADNITYRRCHFLNAYTDNYIYSGTPRPARNVVYEDCTFEKTTTNVGPGRQFTALNQHDGVVRRCKVVGFPRGMGTGLTEGTPCELLVEDVFIDVDLAGIAGTDFHGEAFQYTGGNSLLTFDNVTCLVPNFNDVDSATGGVFSQNHTAGSMVINRLLTSGGIWGLRLEAMPPIMTATNVYVIEESYSGLPVSFDVAPAGFTGWLCTLDVDGQPVPGTPIVL